MYGSPIRLRSKGCRSAFRGLALCVTTAWLAGCASGGPATLDMMPAPAAYEQQAAPFGIDDGVAEAGEVAVRDMLYVTNRAPAGADDEERFYSGERGYLLRAGAARIAFGDTDITWDEAREISLLKNRPGSFPLRVHGLTEFGVLADSVSIFTPLDEAMAVERREQQRFLEEVERRLAQSAVNDIFIYVHGYKVNFENPLLVASELWHFLGHEGAFVAFSWPSTPQRLAYMKDIETARVSAWALRKLGTFLARESSARRIHIVGYSAGTRVVLTTLYELALLYQNSSEAEIRAATRLGRVVLVGSDVDTGAFASSTACCACRRISISMSRLPTRRCISPSACSRTAGWAKSCPARWTSACAISPRTRSASPSSMSRTPLTSMPATGMLTSARVRGSAATC